VGIGGKYHVHCIVTVSQQYLCRDEGIWDRAVTEQGTASIFSVENNVVPKASDTPNQRLELQI
jgi:hypothetical protein